MIGNKRNALLFAERIFQTQLTAEEHRFVERSLSEQQAALKQREFFVECLLSSLPAKVPPA